jgi:hypothetical protein
VWEACGAEHDRIKAWLEKELKLTSVQDLLARRGVKVPYRTRPRHAAEELGFGGRARRCRGPMVSRATAGGTSSKRRPAPRIGTMRAGRSAE